MTTIFAPISSVTNCGVILIRISGPKTILALEQLGIKKELQPQKAFLSKIFNPQNKEQIDEALITYFKSPNSFTGQDVAEISIHASPFILQEICQILSKIKNVRMAEAGEFSKIAFLNNKIDLVQAEAIPDLIAAETASQHNQALKQLNGNLGAIYEDWRFRLIEISALIEAAIDFPEDDLPPEIITEVEQKVTFLQQEIKNHLNDKNIGQKIKQGLDLAIIGAANAGKSSLINFLAQSEVAIVSNIAGTTRDLVQTHLNIGGIAVNICDTAGIRQSDDKIEIQGINLALKKAKTADLKILVIDATNPIINHDLIDNKTIVIVNKSDLEQPNINIDSIAISLKTKKNLTKFVTKLEQEVKKLIVKQSSPVITQQRYRYILQEVEQNLANFSMQKNIELCAEDLRIAAQEIGKITGKIDIENILDVIFSSFCIGK